MVVLVHFVEVVSVDLAKDCKTSQSEVEPAVELRHAAFGILYSLLTFSASVFDAVYTKKQTWNQHCNSPE